MVKRMLACWLALAVLCGFAKTDPDPLRLTPVINAFRFNGVDTTVEWRTCGQVNAFYNIAGRKVILCNEAKTLPPGIIRYMLAHELAHGVIIQRDVAYTGSDEWAADELAALMLLLIGNDQDVLDGAGYWLNRGSPEDPTDAHYGDDRRGWNMLCIAATKTGDDPMGYCSIQWDHVVSTWVRLLDM
jgi:hypothetical protein